MTISVVIPYRNSMDLLIPLLTSLASQSYPTALIEIMVVDDASNPPLDQRALQDLLSHRISVIRIGEHDGYRISSLRNTGIRACSGDIVLSLDQDVVCPPNLLELHARVFHVCDDATTFGLRRFVDPTQIPDPRKRTHSVCSKLPIIRSRSNTTGLHDKRLYEVSRIHRHPYPFNCLHGCNMAFVRKTALDIGFFDEVYDGYFGYEDIDFGGRLWRNGCFIVYVPGATVVHLENESVDLELRASSTIRNRKFLFRRYPGLERFRSEIKPEVRFHANAEVSDVGSVSRPDFHLTPFHLTVR